MPRQKRPYQPGGLFHLAARTYGRQRWFKERLRTSIVHVIAEALQRTDARLIAFAIMENHFHLIVRQGSRILADLMHPVVRRTALRVQHALKREGYIFERRYRAHMIGSARHLRHAIYYVHRNPVKAGLCPGFEDYAWTSHRPYCGVPNPVTNGFAQPALHSAIEIYAAKSNSSLAELRADYQRYIEWRTVRDQLRKTDPSATLPPHPPFDGGDAYWAREFGGQCASPSASASPARPDLRDLVNQMLREQWSWLPLDVIRLGRRDPRVVEARHAIVRSARRAGYRGFQIARYLNCSETTVSRIIQSEIVTE